jgi:Lon protease-like protein
VTRHLPIFPLGTVLTPTQFLPLHIFEPRYRELMARLTEPGAVAEMGVVLIERGREVGGGEQRMGTGTVARLIEAEMLPDGRWVVLLVGTDRFRVVDWLPDDPFPQAVVEDLPELAWDPADDALLAAAEGLVREAVVLASELGESAVPAGFELAADPVHRSWQLCTIAPLGPMDRQRLLEAPRAARLVRLAEEVADAKRMLAFRLGGG